MKVKGIFSIFLTPPMWKASGDRLNDMLKDVVSKPYINFDVMTAWYIIFVCLMLQSPCLQNMWILLNISL